MTRYALTALAALVFTSAAGAHAEDKAAGKSKKPNRLFEMRVYTTNEGKLKDLHARFRNHTNKLFKRHGMDLVAYWTPVDKEKRDNTLVYILAYADMEARQKAWKAFLNDPQWKKAYKASIAKGRLVKGITSQFLKPTDYSPIK